MFSCERSVAVCWLSMWWSGISQANVDVCVDVQFLVMIFSGGEKLARLVISWPTKDVSVVGAGDGAVRGQRP